MSIGTFIVKSGSKNFVIGAYLTFGSVLAFILAHMNENYYEGLPDGIIVGSSCALLLIYIQPEEWLNNLWMIKKDVEFASGSSFITYTRASQIGFLNKEKDQLWGTLILILNLFLLVIIFSYVPEVSELHIWSKIIVIPTCLVIICFLIYNLSLGNLLKTISKPPYSNLFCRQGS